MTCRTLAVAVACVLVSVGVVGHLKAQGQLRQAAYVKASNTRAGDHFGCGGVLDGHTGNGVTISADGRTMAVGAPHESSGATGVNGNQGDASAWDAGAVYVYTLDGSRWSQQAYIKASNSGVSAEFGHVVALSADGDILVVSAYFESSGATGVNGNQADTSIPQAGAVYVFARSGSTWTQQAYLKASNTGEAGVGDQFGEGDQFGFSLALSADGTTIAVGAIREDSGASGINGDHADNSVSGSGAVYVFSRTGASWSQQAYIKASMPAPNVLFGYAVALDDAGDTLMVTSYDENQNRGAAYVFARDGSIWSQEARLQPSIVERNDSFGVSAALSGDGNTLAIGSTDEDCLTAGVNPNGCESDTMSDTSAGAAVVFVRTGDTWTEQALLKASTPGAGDWFASRLAISGDGNTLAVTAPLEDGAAQGINGNEGDLTAGEAGAAYVFVRRGTTWTQQAYAKGSNTTLGDEFGSSAALSRDGRTMVIAARIEGSAARGINGDQADRSAPGAGAVYVFAFD